MQETQETWVQSLGREDPLEWEMATHSSILAWRIPWTAEPQGLQSMGLQRVRHDCFSDFCTKYHNEYILKCYFSLNIFGSYMYLCRVLAHSFSKLFISFFLHFWAFLMSSVPYYSVPQYSDTNITTPSTSEHDLI